MIHYKNTVWCGEFLTIFIFWILLFFLKFFGQKLFFVHIVHSIGDLFRNVKCQIWSVNREEESGNVLMHMILWCSRIVVVDRLSWKLTKWCRILRALFLERGRHLQLFLAAWGAPNHEERSSVGKTRGEYHLLLAFSGNYACVHSWSMSSSFASV